MTEPAANPVDQITRGYTFDEPAIELGVLMEDDAPVVDAKIRIPLSMLNRHGLVAGATGSSETPTEAICPVSSRSRTMSTIVPSRVRSA